jgi:hypothetical protein
LLPARARPTAAALVGLLLVACGAAPSPTPGDVLAVRDELTVRGVRLTSAVSGESACPSQPLSDNVLHLTVELGGGTQGDVYLYLFRSRLYEETDAQMDACVEEYARTAGTVVDRVDVAPYRAIGAGWDEATRTAVREALEASAGG